MIMDLIIKEEELQRYGLTAEQAKSEFAVAMWQKEKLSSGQAMRLLGIGIMEWQELLFDMDIDFHGGLEGFEQDMRTLEKRRKQRQANAQEV